MKDHHRIVLAAVALTLGAWACRDEPVDTTPIPPPETDAALPTSTSDAEPTPPPPADASRAPDAARGDGSCPAPVPFGTSNVPAGYLPAVEVGIVSIADGDSGRYDFPTARDQGVRMLYVNTEESFGDETTPFGVASKATVIGWIRAARSVKIAVRESSPGSGRPDLDPYDRWLSLVFLDGELLQSRIVREGLSAYYTLFGCAPPALHENLLHSEAAANAAKVGIWGPGQHNDYRVVLGQWIGSRTCRPNPFLGPYCP